MLNARHVEMSRTLSDEYCTQSLTKVDHAAEHRVHRHLFELHTIGILGALAASQRESKRPAD